MLIADKCMCFIVLKYLTATLQVRLLEMFPEDQGLFYLTSESSANTRT